MGTTFTTLILGAQSVALAATGVIALAGIGVGSTALRIGVGLLLLVLGAIAGGIALGVSEGNPSARSAAVAFQVFVLALVLLWVAPMATIVGTTALIVVAGIVHRQRRNRPARGSAIPL